MSAEIKKEILLQLIKDMDGSVLDEIRSKRNPKKSMLENTNEKPSHMFDECESDSNSDEKEDLLEQLLRK